ncbi:MAG TPA: VWA domain-containing protein [Verrucomicrobiae bacterium]|jgi:VWFA-related protein|nr:VWA domain-containing protein [Verrucomicrobiae bacterium]
MRARTNISRRVLACLAAAALLTASLGAQNAPAPAPQGQAQPQTQTVPVDPRQGPPPPTRAPARSKPTIRSTVSLVEIDVQVTDRDGKPVKGLKQSQFSVTEDGKAQKISTFEYNDIEQVETAGKGDETPVTVPLGTVTSPQEIKAVVRDHRMIVLFFDLTSLEQDDLLRSTRAAQKYLNQQMTAADLVAVVVFGNTLRVVANFTNDRALLHKAVDAIVPGHEAALAGLADAATAADGEAVVSEDTGAAFTADDTEFNIFNTDRKLAAVEALCEILEGIPGKKSIIQFTSGITQTGEENRSELIAATNSANRSNVSIYTVDSRGLLTATPGGDASTGASGGNAMFTGATVISQSESRQDSRETLATLAGDTGGRSFFDTGDFGKVFQSVQNDTSGYYLVGYYSTNAASDGAWRRVHVKVEPLPSGVRIRAREGYYAPKNFGVFTTEDRERQLEEAFKSDTPEVELPLAVETAQFRLSPAQVFVPISAKLAPSALQWAQKRGSRETAFDFAAEVHEAKSNRVVGALRDTITVKIDKEHFQDIQQLSLVYQGGIILAPGEYKLKFLARENESGKIGTFEENLSLAPPRFDRLQLSTLLLSSQVEALQNTAQIKTQAYAQDAKLKSSPLDLGGERIIPSVTRLFTGDQTLYVFFQAYAPQNADANSLRAGLVFFRNGLRLSDTPMVSPTEYDEKTRTASFRLSLPLASLGAGRYTVQAVVVDAGTSYAAFARNYFALKSTPKPAATAAVAPPPGD